MKVYRKGGIGALMDEYERASSELKRLLEQTLDAEYSQIVDTQTKDEGCRSIQTIMTHVVNSGYGYANYIRELFSMASDRPSNSLISHQEVVAQLDGMLDYTVRTLDGKWEMTDETLDNAAIHSGWGVTYTLEQLLEHAIVHILRHRRQIERFIEKMSAPMNAVE
jgi:uncharacterized damage-inducible protein DinB